jgi:hypothetical protein
LNWGLIFVADAARINEWLGCPGPRLIQLQRLDNLAAKPASGSHLQEGMVVVPAQWARSVQ